MNSSLVCGQKWESIISKQAKNKVIQIFVNKLIMSMKQQLDSSYIVKDVCNQIA